MLKILIFLIISMFVSFKYSNTLSVKKDMFSKRDTDLDEVHINRQKFNSDDFRNLIRYISSILRINREADATEIYGILSIFLPSDSLNLIHYI